MRSLFECCLSSQRQGDPVELGRGPTGSIDDLQASIKRFRDIACESVHAAQDEKVAEIVNQTVDLVQELLTGPCRHIPGLHMDSKVEVKSAPGEIVSLEAEFVSPLLAEIATRSRVPHAVRLSRRMRLALKIPGPENHARPVERLTLLVQGLSFPTLPECWQLRRQLREVYGDTFTKLDAFAWWNQHRFTEYPLEVSKLHRLWESLFGVGMGRTLADVRKADAFWAYLHTVPFEVEAFDVNWDSKVGARMCARIRSEPGDVKYCKLCEETSLKVLRDERAYGERLARSAINFCAMVHASKIGQPGGNVKDICKLLTAAELWGPGPSGWQASDNTWQCTDRTSILGRLCQGRLLWKVESFVDGEVQKPISAWAASGVTANGKVNAASNVKFSPLKASLLQWFVVGLLMYVAAAKQLWPSSTRGGVIDS